MTEKEQLDALKDILHETQHCQTCVYFDIVNSVCANCVPDRSKWEFNERVLE